MSLPQTREEAIARLRVIAESSASSPKISDGAERLRERLAKPVRIGLLGEPGAGKSALRDLLAGEALIPRGVELPTSELAWGQDVSVTITLGDGRRHVLESADFADLAELQPAFAEIRAPLPALRDISILETVTDGSKQEQLAASKWAAKRCDMVLWVSRGFDLVEAAIWRQLPASAQNHGFLAITQLDTLSPAACAERLRDAKRIGQGMFLGIFGVNPKEARDLLREGADPDGETVCAELLRAVRGHAEMGRRANLDHALLFLSRHDKFTPDGQRRPSRPISKPPRVVSAPLRNVQSEPVVPQDGFAPLAVDSVLAETGHTPASADAANCGGALEHLRASAELMLDEIGGAGRNATDVILDRCVEAIEELSGMLPADDPTQEAVSRAADVIVLMQLERNESAAQDAARILLQLKRDFEVAVAA